MSTETITRGVLDAINPIRQFRAARGELATHGYVDDPLTFATLWLAPVIGVVAALSAMFSVAVVAALAGLRSVETGQALVWGTAGTVVAWSVVVWIATITGYVTSGITYRRRGAVQR